MKPEMVSPVGQHPRSALRDETAETPLVVAVDGPAGVGKSTTARALASRFDLLYIDTGAMYRALTWAALRAGIPPEDEPRLAALLADAELTLQPGRRQIRVFWNARNVTEAIRTPEVDAHVSQISAHAAVRREMVCRQRKLGRRSGVVMEGRDIGSVVFPLASVKIYLDGSLEARTERRYRQYRAREMRIDRAEIRKELEDRDRRDSQREQSPLIVSPDAHVLDTSSWSLAEQNDHAAQVVQGALAAKAPAATPGPRSVQPKYRFAYTVMSAVARFYGLRVVDRRHFDDNPGTIIASNHISWWDPPIVGSAFWRSPVRTLAKAELFYGPAISAFFNFLDTIPIQRSGFDRRAFGTAIDTLNRGGSIFIFPEGTRRPIGRPGPVRSGLGILMQETAAPAIPVFVRGTCHLKPGGSSLSPLEVRFGPGIRLHALSALRRTHSGRAISRLISRLFEAIYEEMQARSFAEFPQTDWEREAGRRQERAYKAKYQRLFGGR